MKTLVSKIKLLWVITFFTTSSLAQITSSVSSERNSGLTEQAKQAEAQVLKITDDAGRYFKQGLFFLQDNRKSDARESFNKSVEVFLVSGIDVEGNQTLSECYSQLIETVYRMEFPNNQIPQIRSLSGTCGWNIDVKLADEIVKLLQNVTTNITNNGNGTTLSSVLGSQNQSNDVINGFTEQTFEASPLDELAKLELTPEETDIEINRKNLKNQPKKQNNPTPIIKNNVNSVALAGRKPFQSINGSVPIVLKYIKDNFHDPYSAKYLKWSKVEMKYYYNMPFWMVSLKLRAKNLFNAYRLTTYYFLIRNNKVVLSIDQEDLGIYAITDQETPKITDIKVRTTEVQSSTTNNTVKIVKAQSGDTVETLAKRHGANPVEVAKFNGLFVNSKLNNGREIRIPTK